MSTLTLPLDADGQEPYERSLNFSNLPNLQEVYLGVTWMSGGLLWIPTALSTIRLATSPRLSVIKLSFVRQPNTNRPVQVMTEDTGNDLWKVADEVARIEREFGGTLSLAVLRDPAFEVVSDTLNVRFRSCRAGDLVRHIDLILFIPRRSPGIEIVGMESSAEPFVW